MVEKKSLPMTFLIAGLTIALTMYSLHVWLGDLDTLQVSLTLAGIGLVVSYLSIKVFNFEAYINRGFLWAGILLILISAFLSWTVFDKGLRPLIIAGLLILAIWFGTKYKAYLI